MSPNTKSNGTQEVDHVEVKLKDAFVPQTTMSSNREFIHAYLECRVLKLRKVN